MHIDDTSALTIRGTSGDLPAFICSLDPTERDRVIAWLQAHDTPGKRMQVIFRAYDRVA